MIPIFRTLDRNMNVFIEKPLEGETIREEDEKRYIISHNKFDDYQFIKNVCNNDNGKYRHDERLKIKLLLKSPIFITKHDSNGKLLYNGNFTNTESNLRICPNHDDEGDDVPRARLEIINKEDNTILSFDIRINEMIDAMSKILDINNNY